MAKTNTSIFYYLVISLLFSGFLVACQPDTNSKENRIDCLPPLFEFSFPYKEPANEDDIPPATLVASIIPQVDKNNQPVTVFEGDLVIRSNDEVWLLAPLKRYTPSTKEVKEYTIWDSEGDIVYPGGLFLGLDNSLYVEVNNSSLSGIAFARYDDQNDIFEVISPTDQMLLGGHVVPGHEIFEGQDGNFWFVYENNLLLFDPKIKQIKQMLGKEQGYFFINILAKASGDSFFVIIRTIEERDDGDIDYSKAQIIQYSTQTGSIQPVGTPPIDGVPFSLYVDENNRLWGSDFGYFEFGHGSWEWFQVIRSPIFITDQVRGLPSQYSWARADPKLNTHNKNLWFTFSGGLARLDINKNEWCLIARMPVIAVAKDSHEHLWFVSDKQLYKYEFQP